MTTTQEVLASDVVLDLVQILEEAADSGRLVGGDETHIEHVLAPSSPRDNIILVLSDGTTVNLRVRL